jgi:hypothetical protein
MEEREMSERLQELLHERALDAFVAARTSVFLRCLRSANAIRNRRHFEAYVNYIANDVIDLRAAMAADGLTP